MTDNTNWKQILDFFMAVEEMSTKYTETTNREEIYNANSADGLDDYVNDINSMYRLPFDVRDSLCNDYYEPGMTSLFRQYINENILGKCDNLQRLFNDIYNYAIRNGKHSLAYNTIVTLSGLPYDYLGTWADSLAIAATRSEYDDVVEIGIGCFENWENKKACSFLKNCKFEEHWLQKYADEVCDYILNKETHKETDVLSKKNYTWKMAWREHDSASNAERYSSRYSTG